MTTPNNESAHFAVVTSTKIRMTAARHVVVNARVAYINAAAELDFLDMSTPGDAVVLAACDRVDGMKEAYDNALIEFDAITTELYLLERRHAG